MTGLRRIVLLLSCCICFCMPVLAQDDEYEDPGEDLPQNYKLGIKMGISGSILKVTGDSVKNSRVRIGFTTGIYGRIKFSDKFSMQLGVYGTYRGGAFNHDYPKTQADVYRRISLFYVDFPLELQYRIIKNKPTTLVVGLQPSYLGASSISTYKDLSLEYRQTHLPITPFDYYVIGGVYFNFGSVGIQVMAKSGLTNINQGFTDPGNGQMYSRFTKLRPSLARINELRSFAIETALIF